MKWRGMEDILVGVSSRVSIISGQTSWMENKHFVISVNVFICALSFCV